MRFSKRVAAALALVVAALAVTPATADDDNDYCTYFRYDEQQHRWELVAVLQYEERESEFDWDCKYCFVQNWSNETLNDVLAIVNDTVAPVLELIQDYTGAVAGSFGGPVSNPLGSPVATVEDMLGVDLPDADIPPQGPLGPEGDPDCPHEPPLIYVVSAGFITDLPDLP